MVLTIHELQTFAGLSDRKHFRTTILAPLLDSGQLKLTIPNKPNSPKQRYVKG